MNIASICQRRIVTIDSSRSLAEAAALMRDRHVGALVVTAGTPEGQRVVGIATDRDLVIHVLANGLDASVVEVGVSGAPSGEVDEACAAAGLKAIADAIEF